ncbi:MAG: hypothetical protein JNM86_00775 [Phycisphaerae bacterium]|nr:hypothetical protein [Phycisphaerae bacterium]
MKTSVLALAITAGAAICASANADVITYWNFNNSTPNSTAGQLGVLTGTGASFGSGTVSVGPGLAFNSNSAGTANGAVGTFSGTILSAMPADVGTNPGGALAIQGNLGGSGTVTNNGKYIQFSTSTVGYTGISFLFDTRGTGTGFSNNQVSWSTDGVNFTNVGAAYSGTPTSFFTITRALGVAADGASSLTVRITFDGATGGGGNNRIDNVQFLGTAIPAPGSVALVGLAGLVAGRRRRN